MRLEKRASVWFLCPISYFPDLATILKSGHLFILHRWVIERSKKVTVPKQRRCDAMKIWRPVTEGEVAMASDVWTATLVAGDCKDGPSSTSSLPSGPEL